MRRTEFHLGIESKTLVKKLYSENFVTGRYRDETLGLNSTTVFTRSLRLTVLPQDFHLVNDSPTVTSGVILSTL